MPKPFPATSNALVVGHLAIHQTASDVVLGFIRWACGHPPDDDPDPNAGVAGWTLSLHETNLLRVIDRFVGGLISQLAAKTKSRGYENRRSSSLGIQDVHCELINPSTFLKLN